MLALRRSLLTLFVLGALSSCRAVTNWPLWGPIGERPKDAYEVTRIRDIAYYDDKGADPVRHKLDLYVPKGKKDFPVVLLVHGGAWVVGDNRCCGLYTTVGEYLASQGIGAVLPNYRLSPGVKHPEHIKDVARAFAWTQKHIGEQGGDARQLFVLGHSAGGHLVALLATDEKYLQAHGLKTADIKGVIGVSGVYRIPAGDTDVELGGTTSLAFRLDEMTPLRGESSARDPKAPESKGMRLRVNVFGPAFGEDAKVRADASPINHVRPGLPPFLFLNAEHDLPLLPDMAKEMHEALLKQGCASKLLNIDGRNHNSVLFGAVTPDDPAARAIVQFIRDNSPR